MDLGEIHSRQKRFVAFPTGSTFTITPVLCIPVVSVGDLSGYLDIELPFTIKLPNATQISYSGRMDDDRMGIYSVLIDTLSRFGMDGKSCLLRAVCEVAESPLRTMQLDGGHQHHCHSSTQFTPISKIIQRILRMLFFPSSLQRLLRVELSDLPVMLNTEYYGRACGVLVEYPQCPMSLFKLFEGYNDL
ncbi:uncharacterized protein LOC122263474 [Penaeus japonicus]|uniref:uncharacterized protein LOC122263474 n=1 Tax=Penaeus japonicus TaxID=27405 RepID=UPI001C710D3E|nr:uncharacterized protein LOC122263474 [Penaeus japonicus]